MNILVGCEFSGIVREAFRKRGHNAWSCDLEPAEDGSPYHLQTDVREVLAGGLNLPTINGYVFLPCGGWDLSIFHPPCTYLCNSGVRWLYKRGTRDRVEARWGALNEAARFFRCMLNADIPRVAVENPIMHEHARAQIRACDQIIQPWQFGHGETKATCLWLKGLPKLQPVTIVEGRRGRVHHEAPRPDRWKRRSRTYQGIADAMAEQWG